ncbi:MAG: phosphatidylserine/phosphatidylglycerophosphate/cardiolipin synthase-like enzyme [Myxococcota bacterium]
MLEDPAGKVADQVSYKSEAPWPAGASGGVSIALTSPTSDNMDPASWQYSTTTYGLGDKGSPGDPNGQPEPAFEVDPEVVDFQQPELGATLIFSPFDGLEDRVIEKLANAKSHVRMAYFNIRLPEVKWTLEALKQDGVDVHVILDKKTQDAEYNNMAADLEELGIPVTLVENTKAQYALMHHKFIVLDHTTVLTGSANLSSTALNKSDEDLLIIEDSSIATRYLTEWDEMIVGGYAQSEPYPEGAVLKAWMGPEDDLDGKVLAMLDTAQERVLVAMFQMNQSGLINKLIEVHEAGKTVIVVIDGVYKAEGGAEQALVDAGIPLFEVDNTLSQYAEMHSKLMIVDEKRLAMGSFNWTNLASFHNDESLIEVEDPHLAARAAGKFAELLKRYAPDEDPAALGLTTGPQSISLAVGNLTPDPGATVLVQTLGGGPFAQPTPLDGLTITVDVEAGTRMDYRYGVQGPGGTVWETGATHFFTVPYASGPFSIVDAFRF